MKLATIATLCVSLYAAPFAVPLAAAGGWQEEKTPATAPAPDRDPVCGMTVDSAKAKTAGRTSTYEGKTFYFCNDECKKHFDAAPAKYAAKQKTEASTESAGCCCQRAAESKGCCRMGGGMRGAMKGMRGN